jgi:hypothetical protein
MRIANDQNYRVDEFWIISTKAHKPKIYPSNFVFKRASQLYGHTTQFHDGRRALRTSHSIHLILGNIQPKG